MTRQHLTAALATILALCVEGYAAEHAAVRSRPNVIFILADDLGWRDVGFAGAEFFETPHIDRLAAAGMTFTAAYTGGPNCAPPAVV